CASPGSLSASRAPRVSPRRASPSCASAARTRTSHRRSCASGCAGAWQRCRRCRRKPIRRRLP
ncbi:MAG: hypothetical protein AVDCRST_MAG67-2785, partial [uncultured Solirubrobacteraceae bacterium]